MKSDEPVTQVKLLPMGACRLRLSAFPAIGTGAAILPFRRDSSTPALAFKAENGMKIVVSYKFEKESIAALVDRVIPAASHDRNVPRMTFWPHKGTTETITVELGKERVVTRRRGILVR